MFKNLKLGVKITLGFISLIVISLILGVTTMMNASSAQNEAASMEQEFMPDVELASNIERASRQAMYQVLSYGFTEDEQYLESSNEYMQQLEAGLKDARELASGAARLDMLNGEIDKVEKGVEEYKKSVDQTTSIIADLVEVRETLKKAGDAYMKNCNDYLAGQRDAMSRETAAGATGDLIINRLAKITLANEIIDLGSGVQTATWQSQAERDLEAINNILPNFDRIDEKLAELRRVTSEASYLRAVEGVKEAADTYKSALQELVKSWNALQNNNAERYGPASCSPKSRPPPRWPRWAPHRQSLWSVRR